MAADIASRLALGVCLTIVCLSLLPSSESFSLRVEEDFRKNKIGLKNSVYFILNGQATTQLGGITNSHLVRFDESYTFITMEWNRFPNETVDFEMSFFSENVSVLATPSTHIPVDSCIPSTEFTAFSTDLLCTGKVADSVAFMAVLNYSVTQYYMRDIASFPRNLNRADCDRIEANLTYGLVGTNQPHLGVFNKRGVAILSMTKICAVTEEAAGPIATNTLIGVIVAGVSVLIITILLIVLVYKWRQRNIEFADTVKNADHVQHCGRRLSVSEHFSDIQNASMNPQYSPTAVAVYGDFTGPYNPNSSGYYVTAQRPVAPVNLEETVMRWQPRIMSCQVPRSAVLVGEEIGRGAFGRVCIGNVILDCIDEPVPCAIKTLKVVESSSDVDEFLEEAVMLKDFNHKNIMKLLGVALDTEDLPMVCLEFMHHGDLRTYLRKMRGSTANLLDESSKPQLDTKLLLHFCTQAARGMEYLAAKYFVHRDLAARNCMLDKDLHVKIGDFGLARDIDHDNYYRMGTARALPVKWMALETLIEQRFTVQSDVWSFGIVMWEIFSLGISPYPGAANHEMLELLKQNVRLPPPDNCPIEIYGIMRDCWQVDPSKRPTFEVMVKNLEDSAERLYENMPVYITDNAPTEYENFKPAPPGSIFKQISKTSLGKKVNDNSLYNGSLAPYNRDKYEVFCPETCEPVEGNDQPRVESTITPDVGGQVMLSRTGRNRGSNASVPPPVLETIVVTQPRYSSASQAAIDEDPESHYKNPPAPIRKRSPVVHRSTNMKMPPEQEPQPVKEENYDSDHSSSSV